MWQTLRTSQVHFSVVKWAKSDVALCGGKGEKGRRRRTAAGRGRAGQKGTEGVDEKARDEAARAVHRPTINQVRRIRTMFRPNCRGGS